MVDFPISYRPALSVQRSSRCLARFGNPRAAQWETIGESVEMTHHSKANFRRGAEKNERRLSTSIYVVIWQRLGHLNGIDKSISWKKLFKDSMRNISLNYYKQMFFTSKRFLFCSKFSLPNDGNSPIL